MKTPVLLATILLCTMPGCVLEWDNKPSANNATSDSSLIGEYYTQDSKGVRRDATIARSDDRDYPFAATFTIDKEPVTFLFQTYKIGNTRLIFVKAIENVSKEHLVFRYNVTRTQVAIEMVGESFFKENPKALPGTKIETTTSEKYNVKTTKVRIVSKPTQIDAFFLLHGESDEIYDTNDPMLLNRIGT
ncbi:hypothetical protein EC9_26900 [Rosistilla ulvae]|uniref:Lipoprotein n=1 Tax=Rosistilla ulvae TaxID=1930277 RepID=A0A517M105_9BACT|nr:hypothetical protein [Rosistilla ulvae]QDS88499.1 hypothetical protein EC9_26900 [Rosistilla ulvae]